MAHFGGFNEEAHSGITVLEILRVEARPIRSESERCSAAVPHVNVYRLRNVVCGPFQRFRLRSTKRWVSRPPTRALAALVSTGP